MGRPKRVRRFRARIITSMAVVVLVALVTGTVFFCVYVSGLYRSQVLGAYEVLLDNSAANLAFFQQEVETFSRQVSGSIAVQKAIHESDGAPGSAGDIQGQWRVRALLREYRTMVNYCVDIDIVTADGRCFTTRNGLEEEALTALTAVEKQEPATLGFSGVYPGENGGQLVYNASINDIVNSVPNYATIYVWVYGEAAEGIVQRDIPEAQQLYLLDGGGGVLFSTAGPGAAWDEAEAGAEAFVLKANGMANGWQLALLVPKSIVTDEIWTVIRFFVFWGILLMVVVLLTLVPVLLRFTQPIKQLSGAAHQVAQGDLDVRVDITTEDELQALGEAFNDMTAKLKTHIGQVVEHEQVKNRLELNLLMAQINPHFIYNTLNSVIYLAAGGHNQDVIDLTRAFISALQENLQVGGRHTFSTLQGEIDTVCSYGVIQRYRYPDKFVLELDVAGDCWQQKVPRMLLQPIVENSLLHGIFPKDGPGVIRIAARRQGPALCIEVRDDGVGMDEAALAGMFEEDPAPGARMHSIGLKNIRERLALLYGPGCTLTVESRVGAGTSIQIRLPLAEPTGREEMQGETA